MHKDSPVAETINTVTAYPFPFFFFCGTKSLHHRWDQGRDLLRETDPFVGQYLFTHLLYKVHSLFSAQRQSSGQNNQHTHCFSFSSFLWDQVFASQTKTKEEICWVKLTPLWVSSYSPISCKKSTLCSAHKVSPMAETINALTAYPFPFFSGTKSLHHRLRLRKRFVG